MFFLHKLFNSYLFMAHFADFSYWNTTVCLLVKILSEDWLATSRLYLRFYVIFKTSEPTGLSEATSIEAKLFCQLKT